MPFDTTPRAAQHGPSPRAGGTRTLLPRRGTPVLDDREAMLITVESGCLWITLEGDLRDIVLASGMRFAIDRCGRAVIAAAQDSRFRLENNDSAACSLLVRIGKRLARAFAPSAAARPWLPYY